MKVGDRVKVVNITQGTEGASEYSKYIGKEGVIDSITIGAAFPVGIKIDGVLCQFREDELSVIPTIEYPPINAIVRIKDTHPMTEIRGFVGRVVLNDGGVIFDTECKYFHTLCGTAPDRRGYWVELNEVDVIGWPTRSEEELKKEENMNDDLERVIREGNMAMKLATATNSSPTIAYTEEVKPTVSSLKKKAKRVGFVSTPLKSTI